MRIITRLNVGGPSYQAIFLTQRLGGPEWESRLVVGSVGPNEGSMEGLARERGVPFQKVPGLGREISLKSDGLTLAQLYREIRRFRPHLVHTHLAKAGTLGRIAARLARVPLVVHTYHGHVFHGYFSPRKTEFFLRIERALARQTDRLIVLGEAQEQEILGYGVGRKEQMVRIPLGLELEPYLTAEHHRGRFLASLGLAHGAEGSGPSAEGLTHGPVLPDADCRTPNAQRANEQRANEQRATPPLSPLASRLSLLPAPTVGIVARLVPIKAHELFLRAARRVAQRRPDTRFLLIGDGDERDRLEQQARQLGFEVGRAPASHPPTLPHTHTPTLLFTGFRSDLPAVYADLDVVVLCSKNEGLPVTLIEALAAARPVVSTEVGAVRDLVEPGRTGLLVPSGDAEALAAAILRHLDHPQEAAEMGRRGREHVYPRFSIDRLEEDIRGLYQSLALEKGLLPRGVKTTIQGEDRAPARCES